MNSVEYFFLLVPYIKKFIYVIFLDNLKWYRKFFGIIVNI